MRISFCIVLALAACKSDPTPPAPAPAEVVPVASQPLPAITPSTAGAPGSQNLAPLAGVAARMTDEAARRPHVKVTAEAVFATLGERGITLASTKQVLAATASATDFA